MKEFFKKSTVYKNFEAEQERELIDLKECQQTQNEIEEVKNKYGSLKKNYDTLQ